MSQGPSSAVGDIRRPVPPAATTTPPARVNANAMVFARSARSLQQAARAAGLVVPAFRSPPRRSGCDRTIRRSDRGSVVAIRVVGRTEVLVQRDMVEGVIAANDLCGAAADRIRGVLEAAVGLEASHSGAAALAHTSPHAA